ncbi:MAG: hypothetical protein ARM1_0796 [Candidatus Micrarchaeota archaeon]|nr:MAG: hypothetical protein ARM1_0796 [Candidatus Micrarchaeota archaeon]
MRIKLFYNKTAQQNAAYYFDKAKEDEKKIEKIENVIKELSKKLESLSNERNLASKIEVNKIESKEWYSRFLYFITSSNKICVIGRNADQNELLVKHYFNNRDLFIHADIHGAPVAILKDGVDDSYESKLEAAQFEASYSNAFEQGLAAVDVYALKREQISKSSEDGYLPKGSFLMHGEREWFRSVELALFFYNDNNKLNIIPYLKRQHLNINIKGVLVKPGSMLKEHAAKKIADYIQLKDIDIIYRRLPKGSYSLELL